MKNPDTVVLYPEYFDKHLPRSKGRRVPAKLSVPSPDLRSLFDAASKLGLDPIMEGEKHYPKNWYKRRGRILVRKIGRKTEIIRMVAEELRKMLLSG